MNDFKVILLKEIHPDPNQPRKFFDELAMSELAESVKQKGVLQPILVRPNGKGYILVCGERRFKASERAGIDTIPAVIRDLDDQEALELQIIENLQRKDVHPMEEAVAFKSLIDHKQFDIKEIAARVGKKDYYVKQRLKLNDLTKEWQDAFFHSRVSLTDVLKVSVLNEKDQKELYKEEGSDRDQITIGKWDLVKYLGELANAAFDITDPFIDKKAGPCTACKFNSSVAVLFPEDIANPRCSNNTCFKNKSEIHFTSALKIAKEDPAIIFVEDGWSSNKSNKIIAALKEEGHDVLTSSSYNRIPIPEKPVWEDFDRDDFDSDQEMKQQFEEDLLEYEDDVKKYEAKVASKKYKRAFMLDGSNRGKYVYIEIRKSSGSSSSTSTSAATKEKIQEGKASLEDIDGEISRIQEREKRSLQIDENKIWNELKVHFNPHANASLLKGDYTQVERDAIANALYGKLDYTNNDGFKKLFKSFFQKDLITNVDEVTLRQMSRYFMLSILPPGELAYGFRDNAILPLKVAEEYFPSVKQEIFAKQKEIAEKRIERVNKKIKELQNQKKLLQAQAKEKVAKKAAKASK